jgi:dihydrodipicolinate synthase/N-acetylneuraminate lyase
MTGLRRAALQRKYLALMQANFIESSPLPVKAVLAMMGKIEENYRLPLVAHAARYALEAAENCDGSRADRESRSARAGSGGVLHLRKLGGRAA